MERPSEFTYELAVSLDSMKQILPFIPQPNLSNYGIAQELKSIIEEQH